MRCASTVRPDVRGRPFGAIEEGDEARWAHVVEAGDVDAFAALSGDDNPLHLEDAFARTHGFRGRVVHGMLLGAWLSRVVGTVFPGPGVLWLSQSMRFSRAVYVGDRVEVVVRVRHKARALRTLVLETVVLGPDGEAVLSGEAKMMMLQTDRTPPWSDYVAVVTGASRGIGAAIARAVGARGGRVVVNYHRSAEAAEEVVAAVARDGGEAISVQADVASPASAATLVAAALERWGRIDAIVNNATPPIERRPFEELGWEELDRYWRTYVGSAFALSQAAVPGMRERGFGRIVNVLTSAMWNAPPAGTAGYVAAKSALWGLGKAMAVELGPDGITVNAVSPSAVMTDQWEGTSESRRRALALSVPVQRLPTPEEVAATVLFLLGPEGAYLTGANVPVAGGEVM
jgi:3-oxoacyl-[acyl-carrier protein] reductase